MRTTPRSRWARSRRAVTAALLGLGVAIAGTGVAVAEPPIRLDSQITDTVGALSGQTAEVTQALDQLQADEALQLWVAYVATFDGLSGPDWAAQTAELSGLGGNDMLFAVAIEDRAYGYSVAGSFPVSDADIESILASQVEPELADSDWAGAVVALADGLAAASGGSGGSEASGSEGSGSSILPVLIGGALVVGAGVVLFSVLRSRRRARGGTGDAGGGVAGTGPAGAPAPVSIEELRQEAAAALIEADDSIKTSEQELGFAIAQFGQESAAPFTEALAQAKEELARAFQVQRQAQDATGTPAERALLEEILALCAAADNRLDEQVADFDELRDLERTIDTVLPGLAAQVEGLKGRIATSTATAEGLKDNWPPAALEPLTRSLDEALERIRFATTSVAAGTELLAGDRSGAVAHARAAEDAIAQGTTLLDNVDRAPEILAVAQRAITALVAETEKDIAEAEQLGLPPELASNHAFAVETLTWARTAIEAGNYDPIVTRRALEESDSALEQALVPVRAAAETRRRAAALLASTTDAARMSIQAADDFITTRRAAIGAEARTRLAEAQREFAAGQAAQDPVVALGHMQAADHLSDQAHALAQQDEAQYRNSQQRGGGSGGSGNLGSIILGGILIDAMTRGGRGGGGGLGFPGGGGFSRPSGGSRSGGGRGPASFGGGGTRGRRSGGGRF
jgi:hypothetical protein